MNRYVTRASQALTTAGRGITSAVGTMWCALVFAVLAVLSAPGVGPAWLNLWANWAVQAFLPLVLIPVIMVGQQVASAVTEALIRETHRHATDMHEATQEAVVDLTAIADALHVQLTGSSHPSQQE